jgi:CRISPR-associated protein Cmr4
VVAANNAANNKVVLEEFVFESDNTQATAVDAIGKWLAANALPQSGEYQYWRDTLPKRLAILGNDAFRDFTQFATEVQTHIRLDPKTKTVETGALWTEESLPADTLLYAPLCATPSRNSVKLSGAGILDKITALKIERMQLGGDETTGRGIVRVQM